MRKILAAISTFSLLFAQLPTAVARGFSDVSGTGYEDAYAYLSDRGVVQGYGDGSGRPNNVLVRSEAVKVLVAAQPAFAERAKWYESHMPPISLFSDVKATDWFGPYVETGFEKGVIKGYPDGTFKPGRLLSVEEAVTLVMRSFGEAGQSAAADSPYIENRQGEWFSDYINAAVSRNLIQKRGRLRLGAPITRGQFFDIVYRMDTVRNSGTVAFGGQEPTGIVASQPAAGSANGIVISAGQPRPAHASEKFFSISIPDAGIHDLAVNHPIDPFTSEGVLAPLQNGVGHLFSYPGGGGKIMIYGHSSGYPWDVSEYTKIFRSINKLQPGNKIYVTYDNMLHTYEVAYEQTVDAADTTAFSDNGQGEELILYTCWPPDSIAQRYLVHAVPVDQVALR